MAGKKPATVVVKAASSGSVRVLFGGPTSRALPDSAERAAVCLLCEKSRGDRVERIKARTRSSTDCTFTVGKGDILAFKFTAEPSSRIYLSIVCPCDSEAAALQGFPTLNPKLLCASCRSPPAPPLEHNVLHVCVSTGPDFRCQCSLILELASLASRAPTHGLLNVEEGV